MRNTLHVLKRLRWFVFLWGVAQCLLAQQDQGLCRIDFTVQNRNRAVYGSGANAIQVECPGGVHSYPFGNWGVESPWGVRVDGHQFQGWCKNTWIYGTKYCTHGWYEWNSCTDYYDGSFDTRSPNCAWYNGGCFQQTTTTGVNVIRNNYEDELVTCPRDTNDDGICDDGGCKSCGGLTFTNPWIQPWELDPLDDDEQITTLTFANFSVTGPCTPRSCGQGNSPWVSSNWDPKVSTQLGVSMRGGTFYDINGWCAWYAQQNPQSMAVHTKGGGQK